MKIFPYLCSRKDVVGGSLLSTFYIFPLKSARFILLLGAFVLSFSAFAAEDAPAVEASDFAATWTSLTVKKNFEHGLGLSLRGELRTKDNISAIDYFFVRLTGTYQPCKYVLLGLAYDYIGYPQEASMKSDLLLDPYLKSVHRADFMITGSYKINQWNLSLREFYAFGYTIPASVPAVDSLGQSTTYVIGSSMSHTLRTLATVSYSIPDTKWSPFMSLELYDSLKPGDRFKMTQYHFFAGTTLKINKVNSIRFCYIYQHKLSMSPHKRLHTLGIDYTITLP